MNQILLTDNENNKKKNKNNRNKSNGTNDMRKIIVFFGVVILIFGLAVGGVYGYKIYSKNKGQEKTVGKPQLSLQEDEKNVTILAKSDIGINKIIYSWNDEESEELQVNGSPNYEKMIDIPGGENILKVKVIDQNGQEQSTEKSFYREGGDEKPVIETAIVENAKLKITATDNIAMKYITYRWNNEEDVKVNVKNQGDKILEVTIDVKRGKNTLTITAVDSSDNSETVDKIFNGVNNPLIEVSKSGNKLYMKMSHDMGFEKIEFSVNGKVYVYDKNFSGYDATKKEIEYQFELQEGENTVVILAVSTEGTEETYKGKTTYTPPEQ